MSQLTVSNVLLCFQQQFFLLYVYNYVHIESDEIVYFGCIDTPNICRKLNIILATTILLVR